MKPYRVSWEMLWKIDPAVEEARKHPDWAAFHRACGRANLYFDKPTKEGRTGYQWTAHTLVEKRGYFNNFEVCTGHGKTVIEALADTFHKSGFEVPDALPLLDRLLGVAQPEDDFTNLLGGDDAGDDFEGMLG